MHEAPKIVDERKKEKKQAASNSIWNEWVNVPMWQAKNENGKKHNFLLFEHAHSLIHRLTATSHTRTHPRNEHQK